MLILTLAEGESAMVGDNIEVTFVEMRGTGLRIGITAPKDVTILRKRLWLSMFRAKRLDDVTLAIKRAAELDAVGTRTMSTTTGVK